MAHGTFNPNNNFYSIVIKKCDNYILNKVFTEEYEQFVKKFIDRL